MPTSGIRTGRSESVDATYDASFRNGVRWSSSHLGSHASASATASFVMSTLVTKNPIPIMTIASRTAPTFATIHDTSSAGSRCMRNARRSARPPSPALMRRAARESSGTPETLTGGVTSVIAPPFTPALQAFVGERGRAHAPFGHSRPPASRVLHWRGHRRLLTFRVPRDHVATRYAGQVSEPEKSARRELGQGKSTLAPCALNS